MIKRLSLAAFLMASTIVGCAKNGPNSSMTGSQPLAAAPSEPLHNGPMNAKTHFAAGQLAESRGDLDNASKQYREALKIDKNYADAMFRLGCVQAQLGRLRESIDTWHQYVKLTRDSAAGYSNLAFAEELAGNPEGAERDYKHGVSIDPKCEPCRVNYGLMLARHGRIGEATIQLQAVLEPAQVHYNLASVYEQQHQKEQARIEYQQALALDPDFTDARSKLASIEDGTGN